jgi:hypothetical protein
MSSDQKSKKKDEKASLVSPINLIAALKVFQDQELQSATQKLLRFKQQIAYKEWIHDFALQRLLQEVNLHIVRCGCNICLHGCRGSPANYDFTGGDDENVDVWIAQEQKNRGAFTIVNDGSCALYNWFRNRCLETEGTPVPPKVYVTRPYDEYVVTISQQLGLFDQQCGPLDEKQWIMQVWAMPFPKQVTTVFAVLNRMHNMIREKNNEKPLPFDEWFVWNGLSLLP